MNPVPGRIVNLNAKGKVIYEEAFLSILVPYMDTEEASKCGKEPIPQQSARCPLEVLLISLVESFSAILAEIRDIKRATM